MQAGTGVSETKVVLGSSAVQSGPISSQIKVMHNGAGLAFDAANEQGGVGGRKIKLVPLSDELKTKKAVENYGRLLSDQRALAFFGCIDSGATVAAAKRHAQRGRLRRKRRGARTRCLLHVHQQPARSAGHG